MHISRALFVQVLVVAILALAFACGPGGGAQSAGGPSLDGGAEAGFDIDEFLSDNGIIKMVMGADGVEWGTGPSDATGLVRFYSPAHKGIFALTLGDTTKTLANVDVTVGADGANVTFLVRDDTRAYAPMLFTGAVPTGDTKLKVTSDDLQLRSGDVSTTQPDGGSPFRAMDFSLLGLTFTMSIDAVLTTMATTVALLVLQELITDTCTTLAPLHKSECALAGEILSDIAGLVVAGIPTALKEGVAYAAKDVAKTELLTNLADFGCGKLFGKSAAGALTAYQKPKVEGEMDPALLTAFRTAVYKYNYLVKQLDASPPHGGASQAQLDELRDAGDLLGLLGPKVRQGYLEMWNEGEINEVAAGAPFKILSDQLGKLIPKRRTILQVVQVEAVYQALLRIQTGTSTIVYREISSFHFDVPVKTIKDLKWSEATGKPLIACFFSVLSAARVEYTKDGQQESEMATLEKALGYVVKLADEDLTELYKELYGSSIPNPTCLPDAWEPNQTWQQSLQNPMAGTLNGNNVVSLRDLNMCGAETDWFAYSAGPINLQVQARIRKPTNGVNTNKRVCVEIYWYSEDYQIAMLEPSRVTGPTCGTVDSELSTAQVGVGGTLGESFRDVLVKVYPDPANGTTIDRIDYALDVHP